jgi:hypothetical protein
MEVSGLDVCRLHSRLAGGKGHRRKTTMGRDATGLKMSSYAKGREVGRATQGRAPPRALVATCRLCFAQGICVPNSAGTPRLQLCQEGLKGTPGKPLEEFRVSRVFVALHADIAYYPHPSAFALYHGHEWWCSPRRCPTRANGSSQRDCQGWQSTQGGRDVTSARDRALGPSRSRWVTRESSRGSRGRSREGTLDSMRSG